MSNILSEINRVREIMGVLKEQEKITNTDVVQSDEDFVASEEYPLIEGDDRRTFTGKGTMIWSNLQTQGEFNNGQLNGQGKELVTMIDEDEWIAKHEGEFKDGSLDGQGTATWPNGGQYVGEWKDGSFDGQGTYTHADGKIEKGIFAEGDYIQGTTTFTDGTEEEKKRIEDFSWPSNISQEIQEWAKEKVSITLSILQDGITSTCDAECLGEYREQLIRLQEEPVSIVREDKEWFCKQFKEGEDETYIKYEEKCLTYTKLLLTQGTDETVDVNKVVKPPTDVVTSCAEQNLCDDPDNAGECIACEVASELPLKGCMDPDYEEYDEKYVIDDAKACVTFAKTIGDLKGELKSQWQKEVKTQLDIVGKGDIYGFQEAYMLQNENKLEAVLVMLNNLLCVSAHVAKALLLTQNRTMKYSPEKLLKATDTNNEIGEGHLDLVAGIKSNLKLIDRSFKWWKNKKLGKAVDAKIEPIKTQLKRASDFIDALIPYINWDEEITFSDGSTHRATSTHDLLMNSKNKRETILNCAQQ